MTVTLGQYAVSAVTPDLWSICLLAPATATNSPPSGSSAGIAMNDVIQALGGVPPGSVTLYIASTAGSGVMTATFRLWGYCSVTTGTGWTPLGVGTDANKGVIDNAGAVGEVTADSIVHAEPIDLPAHFDRLYLEITAIGGTNTSVVAYLRGHRGYARSF